MHEAGFKHQIAGEAKNGQNTVLAASRCKFAPINLNPSPDDASRIAALQIGSLLIAGVYFANGKMKNTLFDFLLKGGIQPTGQAVLIGDFNTGLHRFDESGATFHCAEKFAALSESGWCDGWRLINGMGACEYSWHSSSGNGFRIDHAFVSLALEKSVQSCR